MIYVILNAHRPHIICAGAITAILLVSGAEASAFPFSYARAHPQYCVELMAKHDEYSRSPCLTRGWCNKHWNDDRITRIACDPMRSKANARLPRWSLDAATLDRLPFLSASDRTSDCEPNPFAARDDTSCSLTVIKDSHTGIDRKVVPEDFGPVKVAMRADIAVGPFPVTVVRIGLRSSGSGDMAVSWNDNGRGPRVTKRTSLGRTEIDHLLAALNASDFWRLPHEPRHVGPLDGELATVEVSAGQRNNHVRDAIGDPDAADSSILVNAISTLIGAHWKNVPGGG